MPTCKWFQLLLSTLIILFNIIHLFASSFNYYICFNYCNLMLIILNRVIGLLGRVFVNDPGDWGSIPGRVISMTQNTVLDATLLNTQHYKARIKSKVEQSREWSNALSYTSV